MGAAIEKVKQKVGDKVAALSSDIGDLKTEADGKIDTLKAGMVNVAHEQKKMKHKMQSLENRLRTMNTAGSFGSSAESKVQPPTCGMENGMEYKIQWKMYRRQFKVACEANYWMDNEKATALILALRGEALNTLQYIPESTQEEYGTLIAQLDMRFDDQHMQPAYQMQLRTRTQKSSETLQEFESDLARLWRLSYPTTPAPGTNWSRDLCERSKGCRYSANSVTSRTQDLGHSTGIYSAV